MSGENTEQVYEKLRESPDPFVDLVYAYGELTREASAIEQSDSEDQERMERARGLVLRIRGNPAYKEQQQRFPKVKTEVDRLHGILCSEEQDR